MTRRLDDVDPKVRALELGADDYLVKPVEAKELLARVKVTLDRADRLRQQGSHPRGRLTVVAGAKGGIGTSTVAMNLAAIETISKTAEAVVLADLAVPVGTLGSMLNNAVPDRWVWKEVLEDGAASVHRLASYLMRNPQVPLRLLPGVRRGSSYREVLADAVSSLGPRCAGLVNPSLCEADVILIVVEPEIVGVELTAQFPDRLRETGILSHRIRLVISNPHGSLQLSRTEVAAALKMEVAAMILYQRDEFSAASKRRRPIVLHQQQAPVVAQFKELAQHWRPSDGSTVN